MGQNLDLEKIYALYVRDLYRYVYSLCKNKSLAEDIVQETFYRAYFYVESYKQEKIRPWLFKVAYHTFIDFLRKEKRVTYYDDIANLHSKAESEIRSAEEEYLLKNSIEQWFEILETFTVSKRNIVLLKDYYDFSYQEIAEMLDISMAKVKVTLYRCRKEIQNKMDTASR